MPAVIARAAGLWVAGSLAVAALVLLSQRPMAPELPPPAIQVQAAGAVGACAGDLGCVARQALPGADHACRQAIEQLAVYGARWIATDSARRFDRHVWLDALRGTLTYGGDAAEFELGSGHFRRVHYECDFDPGQQLVLGVRTRPR